MKVSIIGAAGTLGSCAAFIIAVQKLADEILLIDPWENMLKAHWMDLTTAAAGQDVSVRRGTFEDISGSDIVVVTAGAPSGVISSRSELITGNLPIIKENAEKIREYCPDAIVITETNPVDPLNYATYLINRHAGRKKFIGYTMNDTIRFRMWTAEAMGVGPSQVQGIVVGEHGHSQVMLFSSLRVKGKSVNIDEATKKESDHYLLKPCMITRRCSRNVLPAGHRRWEQRRLSRRSRTIPMKSFPAALYLMVNTAVITSA